jgi:glycine/D-amino acid oxidase-like deaminating enzyme
MRVAVVGSGLQGLCVALEFASRGAEVHVFDRDAEPMARASRQNEGKIHLGYVYANDASLTTARLMARSALRFGPILRELGVDLDGVRRSDPFLYAVHRRSLLSPDELAARYRAISNEISRVAAAPGTDYFGVRQPEHIRRLSDRRWRSLFSDEHVTGAFETAEIAIDPYRLTDAMVDRVRCHPNVILRMRTAVTGATIARDAVKLELDGGGVERFEQTVNCGWCGRLALDAAAGLAPPPAWSFRRKYFLRVPPSAATARVAPTTIVLGGFGDAVRYPSGHMFVSWYPVGCTGIETGLHPAPEPSIVPGALRRELLRGVTEIVPALANIDADLLAAAELRSGVIYALGRTNVDNPTSRLHQRYDVGPRSSGRYHTIDTGKLTTAPYFARRLARAVLAPRRIAA